MLVWLDGNDNTAKAPNENLAREFMELFSLGHGSYSETDVKEAARALTGWKINRQTGEAMLRPKLHDDGTKTVLGTTGDLGAKELVDVSLGQPASAPSSWSVGSGSGWCRPSHRRPRPQETLARRVRPEPRRHGGAARDRACPRAARPGQSGQAAGGVAGRAVPSARRVARRCQAKRAAQAEAAASARSGRAGADGPDPVPATERRRLARRWRLADHRRRAGPDERRPAAGRGGRSGERAKRRRRPGAEDVRRLLGVDRFSTRTTDAIAQVADRPAAAVAVGAASPEYTVSAEGAAVNDS